MLAIAGDGRCLYTLDAPHSSTMGTIAKVPRAAFRCSWMVRTRVRTAGARASFRRRDHDLVQSGVAAKHDGDAHGHGAHAATLQAQQPQLWLGSEVALHVGSTRSYVLKFHQHHWTDSCKRPGTAMACTTRPRKQAEFEQTVTARNSYILSWVSTAHASRSTGRRHGRTPRDLQSTGGASDVQLPVDLGALAITYVDSRSRCARHVAMRPHRCPRAGIHGTAPPGLIIHSYDVSP